MPRLHRAATCLGATLIAASLAGGPRLQAIDWTIVQAGTDRKNARTSVF